MENLRTVRVLVVYMLLLLLHGYSLAAPKAAGPTCDAMKKLSIGDSTANSSIKLTAQNYEAFDLERQKLIEAYSTLTTRFREMDHVVKTMFLALMGRTHAFVYGEPGGAKSAIARAVLNMPMFNPKSNEYDRSVFSIQMQQLLGDQPFKGFIDYDRLSESETEELLKRRSDVVVKEGANFKKRRTKVTADEVQNRGTLIQFKRALIDELEKGNPIAAAAILDVLNEKIASYGGVVVKVNTETVVTTSNMTPYEFLQMMADLGMESTAKPFLDRLVYKVYSHNWITDRGLRIAAVKDSQERKRASLRKILHNPELLYSGEDAAEIDPDSLIDIKLPPVNFGWLGALAGELKHEADVLHVNETVFEQLRKMYGDMRQETDALWRNNRAENLPPYFPPFIFSTRNHLNYTLDTINNSLLLDLMLVDPSKLPSKNLLDFLTSGTATVTLRSTLRAAQLVTTNAVGGARLEISGKNGDTLDLKWGTQLDKLIEAPLDKNEAASRKYIQWEREKFTELWREAVNKILKERKTGSGILAELAAKLGVKGVKSKAQIRDLEELLFYVDQQEVE